MRSAGVVAWRQARIDRRVKRLKAALYFIAPDSPVSGGHVRAFADPWVYGAGRAEVIARRRAVRFVSALTSQGRTAFDRSGNKPFVEMQNFTSLDSKVSTAIAAAVGVDTTSAVSVALEFPEPGVTILSVQFLVDGAAMGRVLDALSAIPKAE